MNNELHTGHVVVGMSGGVDSAVAASLLKEQGCDVVGVFMKNWEEEDEENGVCTAASSDADVKSVCNAIGIPYYTGNFATEYRDRVFSYFLEEYRRGRTPNPDVLCNCEIKFKAFLDFAVSTGAGALATGHYARLDKSGETVKLLRAADAIRIRLFSLRLNAGTIEKRNFPIGGLVKSEVRRIARERGFSNAAKKDSTGVCFIGERNFKQFLMQFLPASRATWWTKPGGHRPARRVDVLYARPAAGACIGGRNNGTGESWFVIGKDLNRNLLSFSKASTTSCFRSHWMRKPFTGSRANRPK